MSLLICFLTDIMSSLHTRVRRRISDATHHEQLRGMSGITTEVMFGRDSTSVCFGSFTAVLITILNADYSHHIYLVWNRTACGASSNDNIFAHSLSTVVEEPSGCPYGLQQISPLCLTHVAKKRNRRAALGRVSVPLLFSHHYSIPYDIVSL